LEVPSQTRFHGAGGKFPRDLGNPDVNRHSFYINLPFGAIAAAAFFWAFTPPKAARPVHATTKEMALQMDVPGVALLSGMVVCFTLAMRWAGVEYSWRSSQTIGTLVGTGLLGIAFAIDQWYQGERALLLTSFLKNRTLLVGAIFEFL
jgi:hypothetical protein